MIQFSLILSKDFLYLLIFLTFRQEKNACCESAISHWKVVGIGHFDFFMSVSSIHIIFEVFDSEMLWIDRHAKIFKIFNKGLSEVISLDIVTCWQ